MLNAMREGAKSGFMKFILMGFMVMAVGGLVLMDVGGFFRGGVGNGAVAKIGKTELPITVFDRTVRRTVGAQGLSMETAYQLGFINQILKNEITNNIVQRAAADMGLVASNDVVIKQVSKLIEPYVNEDIDKKTALQAILRTQGLTEDDFMRMIKFETTNTLLRNALQQGVAVASTVEAKDIYQFENESRKIQTIYVPHKGITQIEQPKDEVLLPLYQAGQERYAIPETRSISIAVMSSDKLKDSLDVSDEELKEIYERDILNYEKPERRVLEQAVLDSQATATAIAEALKQDKDMKQAVKKETGSEDAYLGEETYNKEGLVKELNESAFSAEKGGVIGPVETALGWHVLKLKKVIPPTTEPFDKVKANLKKEILALRVADEMFEVSGQIDDLLAGGTGLEAVAEEMSMDIKRYGPFQENGTTTDLKDALKDFTADKDYILETTYMLLEGEISPVFELANGNYAALRVDTVTEKTYKPFDEVKENIAKTWMQDQREVANKHRVEDAFRALSNGEKNMRDIAAELNASLETKSMIRAGDVEKPVNQASKKLFFALPKDELGYAPAVDGFIIGKVIDIELPSVDKLESDDINPVKNVIKQSAVEEVTQLYLNELFSKYKVKINDRLLTETYGPGSEIY